MSGSSCEQFRDDSTHLKGKVGDYKKFYEEAYTMKNFKIYRIKSGLKMMHK